VVIPSSVVVLLTLASLLLALQHRAGSSGSGDATGGGDYNYMVGVAAILGAALLFALYLPAAELLYRHGEFTGFRMVVEAQGDH
jgi:hypothetical protein